MRTAGSVEIDRPIEEVFTLTLDHVAEWSTVVVEDEVLAETPTGVGATFRTVTEENGRRMEFQGVVTRRDLPYSSAVHLSGEMFDLDVEYSFEDLSGRTRVSQRSRVVGKGIFRWFLLLFGWMMKRSSRKSLQNELRQLKRFCETQPAR